MSKQTPFLLDDRPPWSDLRLLWEAMLRDDSVPGNFTDPFPDTLSTFLKPIKSGAMHLWLIRVNGEPVGAHWFHDRGLWDDSDSVWTAGYRLPTSRGTGLGAAPQVEANRIAAAQLGVKHFFAACRISNIRSRVFVEKCGYHPAGVYPQWGFFGGELDDVILYTLHPQDREILRYQAGKRAAHNRINALVPV